MTGRCSSVKTIRIPSADDREPHEHPQSSPSSVPLGLLRSAHPLVMLFAEDVLTLVVFSLLDARLLARIHMAVRTRPRFSSIDPALAPFQS